MNDLKIARPLFYFLLILTALTLAITLIAISYGSGFYESGYLSSKFGFYLILSFALYLMAYLGIYFLASHLTDEFKPIPIATMAICGLLIFRALDLFHDLAMIGRFGL